ncbi:MAG: hypothetical protein NZ888_06370 [Candidatus Nitrosocaldus sp.]|nr:hypothetical protein [Candidatus Nitrosocaldus sp.]MCS7141792.1 hypothetical protein [Candidatus Nitrosocaldus sp.]MDW8000468.1 hypothetical protein [Candidatus Nitrosocaldus sp.]
MLVSKKLARIEILKKAMVNRNSMNAYEVSVLLNCSVTLAYQVMHTLAIIEPNNYEYDRGILRKKQSIEGSPS